jgi:phosphatidylserine/phosphatidylglycerophosphate/cardiolipin synthase-like enzyme
MTAAITVTTLRDTRHGGAAQQPDEVASRLAVFAGGAKHTLDLAIYDFRLSDARAATVVGSLIDAADRGVAVRIGYDAGKPAVADAATFAALQADPAPSGTADWVTAQFAGSRVQLTAINAAPQLMHCKYVIRDAATPGAQVWTGSTNFTDDAWTLQENNILVVRSAALAGAFATDFDQMWTSGSIRHTGTGDSGSTRLGSAQLSWDFAPGDGTKIDAALVELVGSARTRIVIAAMVLTSHPLLAALSAALDRGVRVSGMFDAGQMDPIAGRWATSPDDASVLADWKQVSGHLVPKHSIPYSPTSPHDFMHNKVLIADDTVVTGSYNFSANAERNAENQLRIADAAISDGYAAYIATIAAAYRSHHKH